MWVETFMGEPIRAYPRAENEPIKVEPVKTVTINWTALIEACAACSADLDGNGLFPEEKE